MQSGAPPSTDRDAALAAALDARLIAVYRLLLRGSSRSLSRTAIAVLALLRDRGPQRITALAAAESVAQPTMTTLVARLEGEGYLTRTPDPGDGRASLIAVTDAGLEQLERFREARAALLAGPLGELDADDRKRLDAALPALDALIQNLQGDR
jgi:DNA-binding MarR family transcriptional regulator